MRPNFSTALATLVLIAAVQVQADSKVPATVDSTWRVTLAADGSVTALEQETRLKPTLAEPLARAIRSWTFEPGKIDGKPAVTETTLYLTVGLDEQAEGYAVRVDDVRTGGGIQIGSQGAPRFPVNELRDNTAALVVVEANYDASGKVVSAHAVPGTQRVARDFDTAAVDAVRRWKFLPEKVGGRGIAATVRVPICFSAASRHSEAPDCAPWVPAGGKAATRGAVTSDPAAKLRVDVIARRL